jgi:hypothetical protein
MEWLIGVTDAWRLLTDVKKLLGGARTHAQTQHGELIIDSFPLLEAMHAEKLRFVSRVNE